MKYRPDYPSRFGSQQDARAWAKAFFDWYNHEHHHTGLALLTPADVHFRRAQRVLQKRQAVLDAAYARTPERFVKGAPAPLQVPQAVWISPPKPAKAPRNENENSHCKRERRSRFVWGRVYFTRTSSIESRARSSD